MLTVGPAKWVRIAAELLLMLVWLSACKSLPSLIQEDPVADDINQGASSLSSAQISTARISGRNTTEDELPLPQQRSQVRFERVLDEFSDGLAGPSQVIQDHYGFIWVGTFDGLARFDGYQFIFYKHDIDIPDSLSSNQVTAVFEDHLGTLWVGTEGAGLNRFDRTTGTFLHFQHDAEKSGSLSNDRVNVIYEDSSGELWIGTAGGGLNRYDRLNEEFIHYRNDLENPDSLASDTIYAVFEDSQGNLWIGTNRGLDLMNQQTDQFVHYQHNPKDLTSLSHDSVYAIREDKLGNLWLGTYGGGLNQFFLAENRFINYRYDPKDPTSIGSDIITSLVVDRSGMLWIGTMGGGVNRLDPRTDYFVRYPHNAADPHSPNSSYINNLFEDQAAIIWVSTARSLDKYDPFKEKFTQQFRQDHVTVIHEDRLRNLWVGAFDGLYKYDRTLDQVTHFRHDPTDSYSLSEWRVTAIAEDRLGILWVGTAGGGLNRFESDDKRFSAFRYDPRNAATIRSDVITVLYVDRDGVLWVGTDNGLSYFDRRTSQFVELPLTSSRSEAGGAEIVRSLLQDQQGAFWIGTQGGGLKRYEPASGLLTTFLHSVDDPRSLRNNVIYALFEDSNGVLWVGTEGGLHRFEQKAETFTRYGKQDGLPDDEIYAILEDQNGSLWISTDHGLSKMDPVTGAIRNYDVGDGLQADQFSGAAYRRRNGEMLFGGVNGISAFLPNQISDNPYLPPVVLLDLRQEGQSLTLNHAVESLTELTLSGRARDLEIEFAALSYSQPERNQHAYMLEGYDTDWNYLGTERIGRYTNLPGGTYLLRLKGANDDGVWNELGSSLQLTVVPPFWETRWFWGLLAGIIIGGAIAGYRIRVMSMEARNQELEDQIVERTKEIDHRRQELEALYQADETMHRHLNLDPLLQALVDVSVDILRADKSAVLACLVDGNSTISGKKHLTMRVGRGISQGCRAFQGELAERLINLKQPVFVVDAQAEIEANSSQRHLAQVMLNEGIQAWMFLPIYIQGQFFGVFNVCYTQPHAFGERDLRLFQALVQRACLAIENAQSYENAQELAVIKERNRLARDLHDSVKQKTFGALAQIGASRRLVAHQPERAQVCMEEAENLVHDVLQELTALIQELYPLALQEQGLADAIRSYVAQWERQNGIRIELHLNGEERLPHRTELVLYRVFQEALANIARHSKAKTVQIDLALDEMDGAITSENGTGRKVHLQISDDGCGFDLTNVRTGLGLRSMRERVKSLDGVLRIVSKPGLGTRLEIVIPG